MYELLVTELAHLDLDSIISYIAVQLVNPAAAAKLMDDVTKCYNFLRSNPVMYEKCRNPRLFREGYRKAVINNYILIYKVDEYKKRVIVLRFFYGARDFSKLI